MSAPKTMREFLLKDGKLELNNQADVPEVGDYEVQVNSTSVAEHL
jgi:hypothetical protein